MSESFVIVLVGLLTFSLRAQAVTPFPAECKLDLAASVPITFTHGHVYVPVTVNGRARVFAIDTGAFTSAISPKVVAEQAIKTYGIHGAHLRDVGKEEASLYATLDEFTIGNQKARDARMEVMGDTTGIDGLIGPDYLRRFDLDFDLASGTLNLFRHHPCHGRAVYWTDDYFAVPMDVTQQGHIRIDVMLDGKPIRAMIDTGSPVTIIGQPIAENDFHVDMNQSEGPARALGGLSGGVIHTVPHRFAGLQIGGINIKNPVLEISTEGRGFHMDYSDLLLGMRELAGLHLYVAYQEHRLYFSRANAGPSDPAPAQH